MEFTVFTGLYDAQSEEKTGQTGRKTLEMQDSLGSMSCKGRKKVIGSIQSCICAPRCVLGSWRIAEEYQGADLRK